MEELKAIGNTLKNRRKELNLSLKEIENATSIRITFLQALEEGEMEKLISPIYTQGFLRQYANFLGIDGEALIRENAKFLSRFENQEFAYGIGTLEMRGHPGGGVKWVPNAFWLAAFGALFFIAWYVAKYFELF